MRRLDFSYNWNNKLDCRAFTTLRLSGRFNIGDTVQVYLVDKKKKTEEFKGVATIMGRRRTHLEKINEFVAMLDTGYSAKECKEVIKRMYRKITDWEHQPIYFYLLKYVK